MLMGRIYYHKVIDFKKPEDGIKELRYIDPLKIRYIRKIKKDKNNPLGPAIATQRGNEVNSFSRNRRILRVRSKWTYG